MSQIRISNSLSDLRFLNTLIPPRTKLKLLGYVPLLFLLALLDLAAIYFIGLMTYISVSAINFQQVPSSNRKVLLILRLDELDLERQIFSLGLIAIILLFMRLILSNYFIKRIGSVLLNLAQEVSMRSLDLFLRSESRVAKHFPPQKWIWALTAGIQHSIVRVPLSLIILVGEVLVLITFAFVFLIFNPQLALLIFLYFISTFMLLTKYTSGIIKSASAKETEADIINKQLFSEYIQAHDELQNFSEKIPNIDNFNSTNLEKLRAQTQVLKVPYLVKYLAEFSVLIGIIMLAGYLFLKYSAIEAATNLSAAILLSARVVPSFLKIQGTINILRNALIGLNQFESTFSLIAHTRRSKTFMKRELKSEQKKRVLIELKEILFSYNGETEDIRVDNLEIYEGERILILGPSGGGKSTLLKLISGVLDPDAGEIQYNQCLKIENRLSHLDIMYIPQIPTIFSGSLHDNIAPAQDLNEMQVIELMESLGIGEIHDKRGALHEFSIDEFANSLSGGQKQRVAFLRAYLSSAQVVCMDEITSGLDVINEKVIKRLLQDFANQKTIIMTTHKLDYIDSFDRIIFVQDGKIEFCAAPKQASTNLSLKGWLA